METKKTQIKRKFVSLAEARPDLAKEWNYEKNGDLKPEDVGHRSDKKVWWICPYDVPDDYPVESLRGKHFDFEWKAAIGNRTGNQRLGCPYLSGQAVWPGFNDLQTVNPELARQWHPIKNGGLKPTQVTVNSNKKVWWYLPYDVPNDYSIKSLRGKCFDFEWQAKICNRNNGSNCPYLVGKAIWTGFNDLATTSPTIAAQWHPTKNDGLKPTQVTANSDKKVWWYLSYDVPNDYHIKSLRGRHFDFEWQVSISDRHRHKLECPYLSGSSVWPGFNDLQTINPELAAQWHPTKNEGLKPTQVTANSGKKVWWHLPYNVPDDYHIKSLRGRHFDFEWQAKICNRNNGTNCPYLSNQAVWTGFNDLTTIIPNIAKEWHPTKNKGVKPTQVVASSKKKVWWFLSYDDHRTGRHFDFEWQARIVDRTTNKYTGCPYLTIYKGEKYIKKYLQKNNTAYYMQQKFSDLFGTGNRLLSYDFAIPDAKYRFILIEYNGIQHYEVNDYFGGEAAFKKQQEHDRRKREYAKQHGYKLITIKYTYGTYEKVAEYLDKHLPKEDCKKIPKKAA